MIKNSSEVVGTNGSGPDDRFAGQSSTYRSNQRRDGHALPEQGGGGEPDRKNPPPLDDMASMPTMLEPPPVAAPTISINDLDSLSEPVFGSTSWLDDSPTGTMADHPLLRGLLMELPAKGSMPDEEWLDRWFDAARSILDLLYAQHANRLQQR
ncbi:MAG TPA: hypothetical protein VIR00_14780 [Micromonosporaceae bacterium]|jgi:hypothetical protein|nr:hypothetical protein [Mycobacterium sp.]